LCFFAPLFGQGKKDESVLDYAANSNFSLRGRAAKGDLLQKTQQHNLLLQNSISKAGSRVTSLLRILCHKTNHHEKFIAVTTVLWSSCIISFWL